MIPPPAHPETLWRCLTCGVANTLTTRTARGGRQCICGSGHLQPMPMSHPSPDPRPLSWEDLKRYSTNEIALDVVPDAHNGVLVGGMNLLGANTLWIKAEDVDALQFAHQQETIRELRAMAAWIRTPGNVVADDAVDACARVLENRAFDLEKSARLLRKTAENVG